MFGKLGDLTSMLKQATEMKAKFESLQSELASRRYDGEAGAGLVCATVNGRGELLAIKIDPKATEDIELLEDLVRGAVVAGMKRAQADTAEEMKKVTGGIDMGSIGKMLGME